MQAVLYEGPFNIVVKEKSKPVLLEKTDAILKVHIAGICGSDLHMYRGHQKTTTGHTMVRLCNEEISKRAFISVLSLYNRGMNLLVLWRVLDQQYLDFTPGRKSCQFSLLCGKSQQRADRGVKYKRY